MPEEQIGKVLHYFSKAGVAAIKVESGTLKVGDTIHIKGHTSDFTQVVESMQIEHQQVPSVKKGDDFGIKVKDHARDGDIVFKVTG